LYCVPRDRLYPDFISEPHNNKLFTPSKDKQYENSTEQKSHLNVRILILIFIKRFGKPFIVQ